MEMCYSWLNMTGMHIYLPNKKDIHIIYLLWLIHLCSRLCNNDTLKTSDLYHKFFLSKASFLTEDD